MITKQKITIREFGLIDSKPVSRPAKKNESQDTTVEFGGMPMM